MKNTTLPATLSSDTMNAIQAQRIFVLAFLLLALILGGCESKFPRPLLDGHDFIIAGQSNGSNCDWSYFESLTGKTVYNMAQPGESIDDLIRRHTPIMLLNPKKPEGIIFVHGESDAINLTPPDYYVERVEWYRKMISVEVGADLPMYFSTVGYYSPYFPDDHFDVIRNAVLGHDDPNWTVAFNGAQYFRDYGLIRPDAVHFTEEGCKVMMDGIASTLALGAG